MLDTYPTGVDRTYAVEAAQRVQFNADWVLANLVEVVERAIQAVPVRDRQGAPTGEYQFNAAGANRALELIGRYIGMFQEDANAAPAEGGAVD